MHNIETKNIIIILILAIAVIGLAAGAMLLHTGTAKLHCPNKKLMSQLKIAKIML